MNGITEYKGFKTTDGRPHDTKLSALIAQQTIDLRAIVQGDEKYGQRQNFTSSEVAELVNRQQEAFTKVNKYYAQAIRRARVNEKVS